MVAATIVFFATKQGQNKMMTLLSSFSSQQNKIMVAMSSSFSQQNKDKKIK
jgi:hypothetical protein